MAEQDIIDTLVSTGVLELVPTEKEVYNTRWAHVAGRVPMYGSAVIQILKHNRHTVHGEGPLPCIEIHPPNGILDNIVKGVTTYTDGPQGRQYASCTEYLYGDEIVGRLTTESGQYQFGDGPKTADPYTAIRAAGFTDAVRKRVALGRASRAPRWIQDYAPAIERLADGTWAMHTAYAGTRIIKHPRDFDQKKYLYRTKNRTQVNCLPHDQVTFAGSVHELSDIQVQDDVIQRVQWGPYFVQLRPLGYAWQHLSAGKLIEYRPQPSIVTARWHFSRTLGGAKPVHVDGEIWASKYLIETKNERWRLTELDTGEMSFSSSPIQTARRLFGVEKYKPRYEEWPE